MEKEKKQSPLMRLRSLRGVTQESLAKALGVSRNTVMRWETGRAIPQLTIAQVKALCETLKVGLNEIPNNFSSQQSQEGKSPLKQLREQAGLTESDLAKALSISGKTISREIIQQWEESGEEPNLPLTQVAALCQVLDVSVIELAEHWNANRSG